MVTAVTKAYGTEEYRAYRRARIRQWREKVFEKLGAICKRCGITDRRVLCIDHVFGGGNQEVKKIDQERFYMKVVKDTEGLYQILCHNCNWIKRAERNEGAH